MLRKDVFKVLRLVVLIFISFFTFTGCSNELDTSLKPANLKEITGEILGATLDKEGNIVIDETKITDDITYINYHYEDVVIGLLAVKNSAGEVKVVVNTCQSCGGSPYAYFVKVGSSIQCQNCGNMFKIDELDNLEISGCNPIAIVNKTKKNDKIIINPTELKALKSKFTNWQGPKI